MRYEIYLEPKGFLIELERLRRELSLLARLDAPLRALFADFEVKKDPTDPPLKCEADLWLRPVRWKPSLYSFDSFTRYRSLMDLLSSEIRLCLNTMSCYLLNYVPVTMLLL